jgi:4-amino-4-deoxy-L-arabinose transferase-like glycosyltransferase
VARPRRVLVGILAVYLLLCGLFNVTLPLFEAPDEGDHFHYADYLARERRLPDLVRDLPQSHEIIQPPLYYLGVALVIAPFDRSDLPALSRLNPDWFDPTVNADHRSVANQYLYSPAEAFPYSGAAWAVHAARLFSSLLGALTVLLVYATARALVPHNGAGLALLAAALTAFTPKFVHVSSIVSNDIAITLAATAACWWMVRVSRLEIRELEIRERRVANQRRLLIRFGVLGALIGLAVLCKVSGLALLVPVALLVALTQWRTLGRSIRTSVLRIVLCALIVGVGLALVAGPWLLYNAARYGHVLAWVQTQAANQSLLRQPPLTLAQIASTIPDVLASYWGVIGVELRYPTWVDVILAVLLGLAVLGCTRAATWALREGKGQALASYTPLLVLIVWEGVLLAAYAVWMRDYVGTENSRLIFPGIVLIVWLVTVGWLALTPPRARRAMAMLATGGLAVWSAVTPFTLIQPAFASPSYLTAQEVASLPGQSGASFGGKIRLQHAQVEQRDVQPGATVRVSVYWGALQALNQSYRAILSARDAQGNLIGRLEAIPYRGRFDTQRWAAGRLFRDEYALHIDGSARRGVATIDLSVRGVYETPPLLPLDGANTDHFTIGRVKVLGPSWEALKAAPPPPPYYPFTAGVRFATDANTDALIQLQGYGLQATGEGGQYTLTLYWLCLKQPNQDYTVFVHVLDASGAILFQQDAPPKMGDAVYPTSLWDAQERVDDRRTITLPKGSVRLRIGWYAASARLVALKADGSRWPDDAVLIDLPAPLLRTP